MKEIHLTRNDTPMTEGDIFDYKKIIVIEMRLARVARREALMGDKSDTGYDKLSHIEEYEYEYVCKALNHQEKWELMFIWYQSDFLEHVLPYFDLIE